MRAMSGRALRRLALVAFAVGAVTAIVAGQQIPPSSATLNDLVTTSTTPASFKAVLDTFQPRPVPGDVLDWPEEQYLGQPYESDIVTTSGIIGRRMDVPTYNALHKALTGDDLPPPPIPTSGTVGLQVMRIRGPIRGDAGTSTTLRYDAIVTNNEQEKSQYPIPLGPKNQLVGRAMLNGTALMTPTRDLFGFILIPFQPAGIKNVELSWRLAPAMSELGLWPDVFCASLAPRPLAYLEIERPAELPEDYAPAVKGGLGPAQIFALPRRDGFDRFLLFPQDQGLGATNVTIAWQPASELKPPPREIRSRSESRYTLLGELQLITTHRKYWVGEDEEPFSSIGLLLPGDLDVTAIRTEPLGVYAKSPNGLLTISAGRPVRELTVELDGVVNVEGLRRMLRPIQDASYCEEEQVVIESPGMDSLRESGYSRIALAHPVPPNIEARNSLHKVTRMFRSLSRSAGRWTFGYIATPGPSMANCSSNTIVTAYPDGFGVQESLKIQAATPDPKSDRISRVRLELDERVQVDTLVDTYLTGDQPTTRTLTIEPSQTGLIGNVAALSLEWEKHVKLREVELRYRVVSAPPGPGTGEFVPMAIMAGASGRINTLVLSAAWKLGLADLGDYKLGPQRFDPETSPLKPEPATGFTLSMMSSHRQAIAPRRPLVVRDPRPTR